jgi:DNA-binding NtrC family response regulator
MHINGERSPVVNWYNVCPSATEWPAPVIEARRRILIIEDDLCLDQVLVRLFKRIRPDAEVDWATTADEVLATIEGGTVSLDTRYDLVVSDILVPGQFSGLDLWKLCRWRYPRLPFILTSGLDTESILTLTRGSHAGGPPRILLKPFTANEMRYLVQDALKLRSAA